MHVRVVWHVFFLKVGRAYRPLEVCSGVLKLPINAWTLDCVLSRVLWNFLLHYKKQKKMNNIYDYCEEPWRSRNVDNPKNRNWILNIWIKDFFSILLSFESISMQRSYQEAVGAAEQEGKVKNRTTYLKFIKTRWWLLQAHGQWWEKLGGKGVQCIRWETGA